MIHFILIDDDEVCNIITKLLLEKTYPGCKVSTFSGAKFALNFLAQLQQVDNNLILLDINMPEMNGWGFLEQFKTLKLKIPVVMMSSSIFNEDIQKAKSYAEVKEYISKPIDRHFVLNLPKIFQ